MSTHQEIAWLDATAQAELVRKKEVSPAELVDGAIARIEKLNPQLNAVITPMYDLARAAARGPLPDGPFTGVPFLLKDLLAAYAGVRMASGTTFMKDHVPDHDQELVRRYKRTGLIVVGKTNTPELGVVCTTEPRAFGATNNPWDPTRSPGGSSGGAAAAVASGMVPAAHASDGGGSIRIPASVCGLFGMKPTRGRTTLGPDFGDIDHGFVVEHAVTRSVRDSAALLDATLGPLVGDPYYQAPPAVPYAEEVKRAPGKLRIALTVKSASGTPVHEDCVAAARDAGKLCESLGHSVEEIDFAEIDGNAVSQAFIGLWAGGFARTIDSLGKQTGREPTEADFEPLTWALYTMGRGMDAVAYLTAHAGVQSIARAILTKLEPYDVSITPTVAEPPVPLGTFKEPEGFAMGALVRCAAFAPFTPVCNMTGVPAMSVPLVWNQAGLPIGVHFAARFGDEATLFRLAGQLEQARPWAKRRPKVAI
jgi:amidase